MLSCPECGTTDAIWGHEVTDVYDGVLYWSCTSCGHAWARDWSGFGRRQEAADRYVQIHLGQVAPPE